MSPDSRTTRRLWIWSAVIVSTVLAAALMVAAYVAANGPVQDYAHRIAFDSARWRSAAQDGDPMWPTRLRMVDDLLAGGHLEGLTREQVQAMLGPADSTDKWPDWNLVYHLGPERGSVFRIDSEWLVIRFASTGTVAEYRIVRD